MNEPITERTPLVIAAEINRIKQQTSKIMLTNAIEVGKRLKEAKALLPHGEWGKWLIESVSYSQRTANKKLQPPQPLPRSMKKDAPLAAKLSPIHSRNC